MHAAGGCLLRSMALLPPPFTPPPAPAPQLLYDGQDAEAVRLLGLLRHVTLMHIHPPFASPADQVCTAARGGGGAQVGRTTQQQARVGWQQ